MKDNSDLKMTLEGMVAECNNEQAEMQELNERFASYTKKIRSLEQQNQTLEVEMKQLQSHESKRVTELYEEEISNLRKEVQTKEEHSSNLELELNDIKERLQKANDEKEEALKKLASLKKDLDAPTLASKALKAEIKSLKDDIAFQKKIHEERTQEIQKLKNQFEEMKNDDQTDSVNSDLMAALQELKTQFQDTANTNTKSETEEWYKSKMSAMKETEHINNETLRRLSQQNTNLTSQSQKNQREISSLTATIEKKEEEIETLKETITNLEAEKNEMKDNMAIQLLEYQDLLKEKGTLKKEITIYRMLLEEEERRTQKADRVGKS